MHVILKVIATIWVSMVYGSNAKLFLKQFIYPCKHKHLYNI